MKNHRERGKRPLNVNDAQMAPQRRLNDALATPQRHFKDVLTAF